MNLNELLQQAQRLVNETKMDTELPRVDRTFPQVMQATQELHSRVTQGGTNDLEAHILLGSKGVDLPKLAQKLESLTTRQSFEPINAVSDTDVEGFLKNERENSIIALIEESNRNIFQSVEKDKMRCVLAEWGDDKQQLLNALVGPHQNDFPEVHLQKTTTVNAEVGEQISRLNSIERSYALEITAYNQSRSGPNRINLLTRLTELSKDFKEVNVHKMWNVLSYMSNITAVNNTDPIKLRQNGKQLVNHAMSFMQSTYKEYMKTVINKHRVVIMRGGIPNVYNMVSSFVGIMFQHENMRIGLLDINKGLPLWPLVYYSLRSGDLDSAIQYLKEGGVSPDLLQLLQKRHQLVKQQGSPLSQPPPDDHAHANAKLEGQLKLEYTKKLRICSDPYKKAVYAVVLACDPQEPHHEVVRTIEDFLWMQLSILSSGNHSDYQIERMGFGGLQAMLTEQYGESYFNARERYPLYFQVLVLTGQFEAAIEFLCRTEENRVHGVHMAIALNEIGMLCTPKSVMDPVLSTEPDDPAPMRRLNLTRLVVMYTKSFDVTDTKEALQYYYFLSGFKTTDGRNLLQACICDLVVENHDDEFLTLIFGSVDPNTPSNYIGGLLSSLPSTQNDKYAVAGLAGDELARLLDFEGAIKLYLIAFQLSKALNLLSTLLSQVVHQPAQPGSLRSRLVALTDRMNVALSNSLDASLLSTYMMQLELLKFFNYYYAGKSQLAMKVLIDNHITPVDCEKVDYCISNLKRTGTNLIKVMPDVLLAAMDLTYKSYQEILNSEDISSNPILDANGEQFDSKEKLLLYMRQRAKALTNMAAALPYRMPSNINTRILQMEIQMQ